MTKRAYTDAERAEAVGLALSLGDTDKAADRSGVPRRTLYRWMAEVRDGDGRAARIIDPNTREAVADVLWQAVQTGASEVSRRMTDPKARLSDVAQALRVSIEAHALLTGAATSRSESVNVNVAADLLDGYSEAERADLHHMIDTELAARAASDALASLPDPTADLDKASVLSLISIIERRLGHG